MTTHPLLVVRVDIAPALETEWNQWYDQVHLPEILKVAGFLSGRRYRSVEGTPKYMTLYELEGVQAYYSEAFNKAKGWGKFLSQISNKSLNVYEPLPPDH
ncbi:MAG: hypothetical protein A3G80_15290 [Betaproteobacteria bacterium RIFCSPLOWO2_12_FULL_62_13b]|nr:MAG: hypothetical protein A3G80_15290 [Betaproteobacteria bacterium RIFCSPLOWO2_12_FULL_62_13b]